jgi:uncharacterized membrane protein
MYNVFQFLHVAAAIVWIGSGVCLVAVFGAVGRAGDTTTLMALNRHLEWLGPRLFGPVAMGTLVFGILAVLTGEGLSFGDTWIVIGLVGVAISLVIVALSNPINKRIGETVQEHGPDHPSVKAGQRQIRMYNLIDLVILFAVVWAMVAKPGA